MATWILVLGISLVLGAWCLELFNAFPFDSVTKVVSLLTLIGLIQEL